MFTPQQGGRPFVTLATRAPATALPINEGLSMKPVVMATITALMLSACAGEPDATPTTAMGSGMGGGMMRGHDGSKTGSMSDMCSKMMAEHGTASDQKKAAMMGQMKGCKMMSNDGGKKSDSPQTTPSTPADPNDHSKHHPPQ